MMAVPACQLLQVQRRARVMREKDPAAQDPKDKYEPMPFADVLEDVLAAFEKLNRTRKREIIKLVKQSNLARRGDKNAGTTTNS